MVLNIYDDIWQKGDEDQCIYLFQSTNKRTHLHTKHNYGVEINVRDTDDENEIWR